MPNRVPNVTIIAGNVTVVLTALAVISVAGWLPLPILIAALSLVACFLRPQWKAGLWMWIAAAMLTTIGALTTPDTSPMELLQIGPARPRNLLMQASLAGTFVNALAYRQHDPRRSALFVSIGVIVTATGITNTFLFQGKVAAAILPLFAGLLISINNISIKPNLKSLRWQTIGTLCFMIAFAGSTALVTAKKDLLYELGNRMLDTRSSSASGSRGIEQPQLGPTYGDAGSTARVLFVKATKPLYLRQAAYTSYMSGVWGPPLTFRRMAPLPSKYILGPDPNAITVLRYATTDRVVYIPAETTGIVADVSSNLAWAQDDSGPVITGPDAGSEYAMLLADANSKSDADTITGSDSDAQRDASMQIPDELLGALERFVVRNRIEGGYTLDTAQEVVGALQREHDYSLRFSPNPGEALASFLDSPGDDAHCAYFASATVMVLRYLGYPARLVSGFFAHEPADNGITVRGRDAHAWAEVNVPGTGWVLVEATPAAGLPSADESSVDWLSRLWEKITDTARKLRTELENGNITFIAVPSVFVAIILAWSYFRKRERQKSNGVSNPYFAEFVYEYNRICVRLGIPKVGNETLMHHFIAHGSHFDEETHNNLHECIENYERSRYGTSPTDTAGIAILRRIHQRLRKH